MANAYFEYKGRKSTEFGIRIPNGISYPSPEADVEKLEMLGRDGDLIIDNERLKSMPFPIPIRIDAKDGEKLVEISSRINGWLKSDIGFHPLILSTQPDYQYKAIITEQFNIEETIREFGRTVITFQLEPYKQVVGSESLTLTNGQVINNTHNRAAKPLITITGTGDIELKNNGVDWLKLRSVDTSIEIDSDMKSAKRADRPQYDKMVDLNEGSFPLLEPGENKITWEDSPNIEAVEVEPRWETIA